MQLITQKWLIRGAKALAILAVIYFALQWFIRTKYDKLIQAASSADAYTSAQVRRWTFTSSMDPDEIYVQLKLRWWPFGHTVFDVLDDEGTEIHLTWLDSKNLRVECFRCQKATHYAKESNWHGIAIRYVEVDAPTPSNREPIGLPNEDRYKPESAGPPGAPATSQK